MTLHGIALFLHVALAIVLVGGSLWAGITARRLRGAVTVREARAHAEAVRVFSRAAGPVAGGVLLAGGYLATVGDLWTSAWLVTSLVLFLTAGALAGAVVDPTTARAVEALDASPDGPVPADVAPRLVAPGLTTVPSLMAGIDLSIVFLMTNKPGATGAVTAAVLGVAGGVALGMAGRRRQTAPAVG